MKFLDARVSTPSLSSVMVLACIVGLGASVSFWVGHMIGVSRSSGVAALSLTVAVSWTVAFFCAVMLEAGVSPRRSPWAFCASMAGMLAMWAFLVFLDITS